MIRGQALSPAREDFMERRHLILGAIATFLLPVAALAQPGRPDNRPGHGNNRPGNRPGPGNTHPGPGRPGPGPGNNRPGPGGRPGPRPPQRPPQFSWRGRNFNRYHAPAFRYPRGYSYRRWASGALLPALFLSSLYYFDDWRMLGIGAPPPGRRWVRYGPDLLLVNIRTRRVEDVIYDAFY
jgi:Ni/Co efflux regulator RcnB